MKKIRLLAVLGILVALVVAILPGQALAQSPVVVTASAPSEVPEGGTFTVSIEIGNVELLNSGQFELVYDETVIQVTSISTGVRAGDFLAPGSTVMASQMGGTNTVRVIFAYPGAGPGAGITGNGTLVEIDFDVVGTVCNTSVFDFSTAFEELLISDWAETIPSDWVGCSVHVCQPRTLLSIVGGSGDGDTDAMPTEVDAFSPGETVAVVGYGFTPNREYELYIQPYEMNLYVDEGDTLDPLLDPSGTAPKQVTSDAYGVIGPVDLWAIPSSGQEGTYWEIVADDVGSGCTGGGIYNAAEDGLDALALDEEGFYVVPEALTIVLFSLGLVGVGGYYAIRRRRGSATEA